MDSQQSVGLVAVLGMRFRTYSNGVSKEMGGGHRRVMSRVFWVKSFIRVAATRSAVLKRDHMHNMPELTKL